MQDIFARSRLFFGDENVNKLKNFHVAVFGIGGVGGICAESLVRSGIGSVTIVDSDKIEASNVNRQIVADVPSIGKDKTEVMKKRLENINPDLKITVKNVFYLPETAEEFDFSKFDYVIDCVDTVTAKIDLILRAKESSVPIISCMGTAGKTDISALKTGDISETKVCPLARIIRQKLKSLGVNGVKVVYSTEQGLKPKINSDNSREQPSTMFVPAVAGLMLANEVIKDLLK